MADELPDVWIARTYLEPDSPVIYAYREKDFDSIRYTPAARLAAAQEQVERLREELRLAKIDANYWRARVRSVQGSAELHSAIDAKESKG